MAQDQTNKMEEDYETPFGPDDSVLVKNLNFSYGDRQVRVAVCMYGVGSGRACCLA